MIDWGHLYGLRADIGSDTFFEVIELFLTEAEDILAELVTEGADVPVLLHMLKGSALAVGLTDVAAQCLDGERRAAAGAQARLDQIRATYSISRTGLINGLAAVKLLPAGVQV